MLAAMVQHGDALKHALAELLRPGGVLHVTCSAPPGLHTKTWGAERPKEGYLSAGRQRRRGYSRKVQERV